MLKLYATDPHHAAHLNHAAAPAPAPSLLARLWAWLHPRPEFKQAPPLRNPHLLALHVSDASNSRSALR